MRKKNNDLELKLHDHKKQYDLLSEEVIRRTAIIDEVAEQIDSNTFFSNQSTLDTSERKKQKELETNYKHGLKDLNYKLTVKEERITALGKRNNELASENSKLSHQINKLEGEVLTQEGKIKVLTIEKKDAENSNQMNKSLYEKAQEEVDQLRDEIKIILEDRNSQAESIKQLEIMLDRRNGEINTLKKNMHRMELDYRNVMTNLYNTEKERDHFATLLDTVQFNKRKYESSQTSNSEFETDSEASSQQSEFLGSELDQPQKQTNDIKVDLGINSKEQPEVIEIIKEHFLEIMGKYEEEKYSKDLLINDLIKKLKTQYASNINIISQTKDHVEVILEIIKVLNQIS